LRRCGGRKEDDIVRVRRARRTHRAAIDTRGLDAGKKATVKAGITLKDCAVAGVMIEIHTGNVIARSVSV
jgi:hypothetical protein